MNANLGQPDGLALDAAGDLFIGDAGLSVVERVTAPPTSLSNVSPSGALVQGGGTTPITWSSTNVGNVDILLSTDGGSTFPTTIASNVPNFGLYAWGVPGDVSTSTAEIKVVDHDQPGFTATSASAFTIAPATTPIISTVAGNGTLGFTGDGGPAVLAELDGAVGMAVDSQGDLFFADQSNNVVREVNHATGVITTIAGNGTAGSSGNRGLATAAELNVPGGVALDGRGNLFIADAGNMAIRELNLSTGTITTVAGVLGSRGGNGDNGPATSAKLNAPQDVAVDSQGDLFIADSGNNAIREVKGGTISTVAGVLGSAGSSGEGGPATSAKLNLPQSLGLDGQGNLFIADDGNNAIREVKGGTISTVAGVLGHSGSTGDGGPATSAKLNSPNAVAVDGQGNLFIADESNLVIRRVDHATGNISLYAGTYGASGNSGDNEPATGARFMDPVGLVVDSQGNLLISDDQANVIRRVSPAPSIANVQPSGGTVQGGGTTQISWNSTGVSGNVDILLSTDGGSTFTPIASNVPNAGVYAWSVPADLNTTSAEIRVVDHIDASAAGTSAATFTITQPTVPIISTVAGVAGQRKYGGDGGPAVEADLDIPSGVAVDAQGNLYIADTQNDVVREVNALTGVITTVAGIAGDNGDSGDGGPATAAMVGDPEDVAVDAQGNLFIADNGNYVIREVNLSTGTITTVAGVADNPRSSGDGGPATAAAIGTPNGIAVDGKGDLFIADDVHGVVREVNLTTGKIRTVAGNGTQGSSGDNGKATSAELDAPVAVAVDGQGHLFIVDSQKNDVREVNLSTGTITTVAGTSANLNEPDGVAVDGQGNLYIADTADAEIRIVNLATGVINTYAGTFQHAGASGDNGPATAATLTDPKGLAVDSAGDLFIADSFNELIRRVTPVASISNVQPSGGTVQGGGATKITWSSTGFSGGVDILLSTDGGNTFGTTIVSNEPNFGVYAWSVPADLSTTTAVIKVEAHGSTSVSATSSSAFTVTPATTPIISTVAGTGAFGSTGNGGPAISALFETPFAVAVDSQGNLFIADENNSVIREVNAVTGIITIVAGNGTIGSTGDGGPATGDELSNPGSVALDASGNLFIADSSNNRIREVNLASGVITTVAGGGTAGLGDSGQATAAKLTFPSGVAVDNKGDLFIADLGNNRIREVNLSTGVITTVAGNGTQGFSGDTGLATSAELNSPNGVAVDTQGDLFIVDTESNVIREVNATTHVITTVAGNHTSGYSGDAGPATSAELNDPLGVALDNQGDLVISDNGNDRIREVNLTTGTITTIAGNGTGGGSGDNGPAATAEVRNPGGMAVDSQGNLFIADRFNEEIRRVTPAPSITNVLPASGTLQGGGNTVITWSSTGVTNVDVLLSTNGGATFPYTIAANLPSSGSFTWNVPAAQGTTSAEIRVVDHINANIKGTAAGTLTITAASTPIISTFAGSSAGSAGSSGDGGLAVSALLSDPEGVAVDSQGDLFIADYGNNLVREVNALTGVITTVAGNGTAGSTGDGGAATSAELDEPKGVAVDGQGDLFIADLGNNRIREVNLSTGVITTVAGGGTASLGDGGLATSAILDNPEGVAVDTQGDLFIADTFNRRVREVNLTTGVITTVAGNGSAGFSGDGGPAASAELNNPVGLALDDQGNLFIADAGNERVREVNLSTGVITTVAGNGTAGSMGDGGPATAAELFIPSGVAVDGQGNLFIASTYNDRIREVNLLGVISTYAGNGTYGLGGDNGPATSANLTGPEGLAVDNQGDLFIADDDNNEIQRVTVPASPSGAIATDTPLIAWQTLEGGVSEDLAITDDSTGQTLPVVSNLTGLAYQLTAAQALPRGHSFTWYIGAVSSGGGIAWSGGTNFSLPALAAPTPSSPSGPIMPSAGYDTPTFSWSSVNGAAMYDLDLKDLSTGMTVFNNTNVSGTTYTPSSPLLVGHSFTWYVGTEGAAAPPATSPGASARASRSTR